MPCSSHIRAIISYTGKVAAATTLGSLQPGDMATPFARQTTTKVVRILAKRPKIITTVSPHNVDLLMRFDWPRS